MKQLGHHETLNKMPKIDMACILYIHNVSCENLGLIMRSADIFGVTSIYYHGDRNLNKRQLSKLSRNANIPLYFSDGIDSLVKLKESGYQIAALEVTDTSIPLRSGMFQQKICLVVGNEKEGIPENILNFADCSYHIEMTGGHISSLNVSIATSIALYEIAQFYLCKANS
jgi:tRNA G18 (ribose-2'-O)-methylase SpoU